MRLEGGLFKTPETGSQGEEGGREGESRSGRKRVLSLWGRWQGMFVMCWGRVEFQMEREKERGLWAVIAY